MNLRNTAVALALLALTGCAHQSVDDGSRTDNSAFNGIWRGEVSGTSPSQFASNFELECGAVEMMLVAQVNGGVISAYVEDNENISFQTNLNDAGKFYFRIPTRPSYQATAGSDVTFSKPKEFFVFRGRLNADAGTGSGHFVHASTDMAMDGCSTPIAFRKITDRS